MKINKNIIIKLFLNSLTNKNIKKIDIKRFNKEDLSPVKKIAKK